MSVLPHNDVVMHGDAEGPAHFDHGSGHLDIGLRRRRVPGGMGVHHPTLRSIMLIVSVADPNVLQMTQNDRAARRPATRGSDPPCGDGAFDVSGYFAEATAALSGSRR